MIAAFSERHVPALWMTVATLSLALTYGVSENRHVLVASIAVVAIPAGLLVLAREPRWAVIGFACVAYTNLFEVAQAETGLPVSKRLAIVVLLGLLAWHRARGFPIRLPDRRDVGLVLAACAAIAFSALVAVDSSVALARLIEVGTAGLAALMISTLNDRRWLARTMWAIALSGAALAAISLYQQFAGAYDNTFMGLAVIKFDGGVARSGGPFEPNFFAQALVLTTALSAYLAIGATRLVERFTGLVLTAFCVAGVGATASRGGALALGVMLVMLVALRRPRLRLIIPAAIAAIVVLVFLLPPDTQQRISSVAEATDVQQSLVEDTSFRGRFAENMTAVAMFRENPLLGVGAHNFPVLYADYATFQGQEWRPVREPHNLFLESFAETGIVGGTTLLVFLWATAAGAWQARRGICEGGALLAEGVFVGLIGLLTTSVFLHAAFPNILWTAFGLAWAARLMARGEAGPRSLRRD